MAAKLIAADAITNNFRQTQSMGDLLSDFMLHIYNDSLIYGFSGHSAEACHEFKYGSGNCRDFMMRDDKCIGLFNSFLDHLSFIGNRFFIIILRKCGQ